MSSPRLVLISAPGCHLCDVAREELGALAGDLGVDWREDDLSTRADADPLWWEQIPVILVDDTVVCYWRVEPDRVRAALAGR